VRVAKMDLGFPDESGRRKPEIKKNSEEILKADLIIEALGFEPENIPVMFNEPDLNITNWGTLKVNYKNLMTSIDGVFAAGDIVRGASLVVWGIKDGRDVAGHVHNYLKKNKDTNIVQKNRAVNE
jgi:glutamate synthase (NADPH/NADH) small chain